MTGNIDVPGGLLFKLPTGLSPKIKPNISKNIKPIGAEKYPVFYDLTREAQFMEFPKAVLEGDPYKIRGLINIGSSISTSYPEPEVFEKAYKELELMVVVDRFMTKDALYAEVVEFAFNNNKDLLKKLRENDNAIRIRIPTSGPKYIKSIKDSR